MVYYTYDIATHVAERSHALKPAFTDVIENFGLRNRLRDEIIEKKFSHAYILEGAKGTGKHMLALRIAAALSCERIDDPSAPLPCGCCSCCKKILAKNSPDVIFINREDKATLGVDAIRAIKQDVFVAPNDVAVKVYIIEDAHLMTEQAQNALLLTLEEPPAYVRFLLLCESTASLLETIRSRAPTLRTEPIPTKILGEHLCAISDEARTLERSAHQELCELTVSANGSIGKALDLLDPKARKPIIARRENARQFVRRCSERHDAAATLRLLKTFGQKREDLTEQLNAIAVCLRDLLLSKQSENAPLCFFADREEALSLAYTFTTPALLALCDHVYNAMERLKRNANVRLVLTELAVRSGIL